MTGKNWFESELEVHKEEEMVKPHERPISHVKTALLWAFYHLKRQSTYEEALRDMLKRGGDTSMNAAIVGGLIGALNVDNTKLN
jgi:ADP-ribosylglycohydrolase